MDEDTSQTSIDLGETMTVRVRNSAAEPKWGSGPLRVVVSTVEIPAKCPRCGGPRGAATKVRNHEDGVTYYTHTWRNPCGHVDMYGDVVKEGIVLSSTNH